MDASIALLKRALAGIHTGRVRSALLDPIRVEAYGQRVPLSHLATVTVHQAARSLVVQPFDPSLLGAIRRAILAANLGLNPQPAATTLRVPVSRPDQAGRQKLDAHARSLAEAQRVAVRRVRQNTRNRAKRAGELASVQRALDALTARKVAAIDALLQATLDELHWLDPRWNG